MIRYKTLSYLVLGVDEPVYTINVPAGGLLIGAAVVNTNLCAFWALSACGVVADAMVATVLVNAFLEKFGQDNLEQIKRNYSAYEEMLRERFE